MGFRGHAGVATLFFIVIAVCGRLFGVPWGILCVGGAFVLLGGLFPDIDTASRGRSFFVILLFSAILVSVLRGFYFTAALLFAIAIFPLLSRHRTLFHKFYFLVFLTGVFCWTAYLFFPSFKMEIVRNGAFFLAGCFSHLVADFGFLQLRRKGF